VCAVTADNLICTTTAADGSYLIDNLPHAVVYVLSGYDPETPVAPSCFGVDGPDCDLPGVVNLLGGTYVTTHLDFELDLSCFGEAPTHVGNYGPDELVGTPGNDVVISFDGGDEVRGWAATSSSVLVAATTPCSVATVMTSSWVRRERPDSRSRTPAPQQGALSSRSEILEKAERNLPEDSVMTMKITAKRIQTPGLPAAIVIMLLASLAVAVGLNAGAAGAQGGPVLEVTPASVELSQPFSISANNCPGPNVDPPGTTTRVEFKVQYLPPPQLPGAPSTGSYSADLNSTLLSNGWWVAQWALPSDAPTLGGLYGVTADCINIVAGVESLRFSYTPVTMTVSPPAPAELAAEVSTVAQGGQFSVSATGCPTPPYVGADYRVEYTLTHVGGNGSYAQTVAVPGAFGDHAAVISIPTSAPVGSYELTAECRGNELGGDFLWFAYTETLSIQVNAAPLTCNGQTVTVNLGAGQSATTGNDVILGTSGADIIDGLSGDDTICALGGGDTISGGGGNDIIFGGPGVDTIFGGGGNDFIRGGGEADTIRGQNGDDQIFGDQGSDNLTGNNGDDVINGGAGDDYVAGNAGADIVTGGEGNDTVNGGGHRDVVKGGLGNDTLNGNGSADQMYGGRGDDVMSGGNSADHLRGQQGNDTLSGGRSNDILWGGNGTDACNGDAGWDRQVNCESVVSVP